MEVFIKVGLGGFIVMLFLFFTVDLTTMRITDEENSDAVYLASRSAISLGVNRGTLRVEERLTINPAITEEAFVRHYAKNIGLNPRTTVRNLHVHAISSEPPMLAVEAGTYSYSFFKRYLSNWGEYQNDNALPVIQRNVVIYEAKSPNEPVKGGVNN